MAHLYYTWVEIKIDIAQVNLWVVVGLPSVVLICPSTADDARRSASDGPELFHRAQERNHIQEKEAIIQLC